MQGRALIAAENALPLQLVRSVSFLPSQTPDLSLSSYLKTSASLFPAHLLSEER